MKIKGIPVGTNMPRSNWAQEDPSKADYIRNKPNDLLHGTDTSLSEPGRAADAKATGEALKKLSTDTGKALTEVDNRITAVGESLDGRITAVGEAVEGKAGVYKMVTGKDITIEIAPDSVLHGLKLYGKSTQDGTPSPENPVEIVSAGHDGDIGVMVCGGNLVDAGEFQLTTGGSSSGYAVAPEAVKNAILSLPNGVYSISFTPIPSASGATAGTNIGKIAFQDSNATVFVGARKTFELTDDVRQRTENVVLYGYVNTVNTVSDFMLNNGEISMPYEPYKGKTLTVPTPNGLPGIKVSSGGNWTDSTGQQWVCDEIDFTRGVYVQRCQIVNLGDYEWKDAWNTSFHIDGTFLGYCRFADGTKWLGGKANIVTHLSYSTNTLTSSETGYDCGQGNNTNIGIRVPTSIASTKEELKAWLAENNVKFLYQLENPIERPLTEEEWAQYAELRTVEPTTYVFNDAGVGMEVSYYLPNAALPVSGGSMDGNINMGNHRITGLGEPVHATDAVPKGYCVPKETQTADWSKVDEVIENGWYRFPGDLIIDGVDIGWCYMFVEKWNDDSLTQTLHPAKAGYVNCSLQRSKYVLGWTPWEWVNPPMYSFVSYRTTERHMGKPVYTILIDCGGMMHGKTVGTTVPAATGVIIDSRGVSHNAMHLFGDADGVCHDFVVNENGTFHVRLYATDYYTGMATYVQIWYTLD